MAKVVSEFESTIEQLTYKSGTRINAGDVILTLNCMKMLISIIAPNDGVVNYFVSEGDYVYEGNVLAEVE